MASLSLPGLDRKLLAPSVPANTTDRLLTAVTLGVSSLSQRPQCGSTCTVYNAKELAQAVKTKTIGTIVVAPGRYSLTSAMTGDGCGYCALCIERRLTIRAKENGTVVLDAMQQWRVVHIPRRGRAELIGLNITGGNSLTVRGLHTESSDSTSFGSARWNSDHVPCLYTGGEHSPF